MPAGDRDARRALYEVVSPVKWEGQAEPLWVLLGRAVTVARAADGEPSRIRVKLDVLSHQGTVLRFAPDEGQFELVLIPGGDGAGDPRPTDGEEPSP